MSMSVDIHTGGNLRVCHFMPENKMCLCFGADGVNFTLFGIDPEKAWALYDLFGDDQTRLHWKGRSVQRAPAPIPFDELEQGARDATLPAVETPEETA